MSIVVAPVLTLVRLVNGQVRIIHKVRSLKTDLWIAESETAVDCGTKRNCVAGTRDAQAPDPVASLYCWSTASAVHTVLGRGHLSCILILVSPSVT